VKRAPTLFDHIGCIYEYVDHYESGVAILCQVDKGKYKFISESGNRIWDDPTFDMEDVKEFNRFLKQKSMKKLPFTLEFKITKAMKVLYGENEKNRNRR